MAINLDVKRDRREGSSGQQKWKLSELPRHQSRTCARAGTTSRVKYRKIDREGVFRNANAPRHGTIPVDL